MKYIACILFFIIPFVSYSQQTEILHQYSDNIYHYNPAFAGMDYSLSLTAWHKSRWATLPSAPTSQGINAHFPAYGIHGAIGAELFSESVGIESNIKLGLSYNYVLQNSLGIFSIGLRGNFYQKKINGGEIRTPDGFYDDGLIIHNDDILFEDARNFTAWDLGLGLYHVHDFFEWGISISNLLRNHHKNENLEIYPLDMDLSFFITTYFDLTSQWEVSPHIMLNSDMVQLQPSVGVTFLYNDRYSAGVAVRGYNTSTFDDLIIKAGLRWNERVTIGYAYGIGMNQLAEVHQGTHEILLKYNMNKRIGKLIREKIIYNPRYPD